MKTLPILTLCLLVPAAYAQERTAAGALETQASWAALKSLTEQANTNAKSAHIRLDQIELCGKKGMLYAPGGEDSDKQGCKPLSASVETLPDTLVCMAAPSYGGNPRVRLLFELCAAGAYLNEGDRAYYGYAGWYTHIAFNRKTGTFLYRRGNPWVTDCEGKSLRQLIESGRAYWRNAPLTGADAAPFAFTK